MPAVSLSSQQCGKLEPLINYFILGPYARERLDAVFSFICVICPGRSNRASCQRLMSISFYSLRSSQTELYHIPGSTVATAATAAAASSATTRATGGSSSRCQCLYDTSLPPRALRVTLASYLLSHERVPEHPATGHFCAWQVRTHHRSLQRIRNAPDASLVFRRISSSPLSVEGSPPSEVSVSQPAQFKLHTSDSDRRLCARPLGYAHAEEART